MKECITCKEQKELSEFPPNRKNRDGLNSKCRICYNEYQRKWYEQNSDIHKARVRASKSPNKIRAQKYNVSIEEIEDWFTRFPLCQCCETRLSKVVDHCHETGTIRGVLCQKCNVGIGQLGDNLEGLQKAIQYLTSPYISAVL